MKQLLLRDRSAATYSLADMAADGIGLLGALGIERAHVVGASMGGMIAQTMAIEFPDRVLSLASLMSNTGHRWKGTPGLRAYPIFIRRPADSREGAIESTVSTFRLVGSPGFPFQEEELREMAQLGYERGYNPAGTARQLAAILTDGDRTERLHGVTAPTVVIHGTRDRMVRPSGGRETAKAIPGAQLVEIEGMGHDLPVGAWDRIVDAIVANAQRADASSRSARRGVACGRWTSRSRARAPRRSTVCARCGSRCTTITRRSAARSSGPTSTTTPRGRRAARCTWTCWPASGFVLLAERGGELIGYALVAIMPVGDTILDDTWRTGERVAEIETVFVAPEARGGGVGSALLDRVDEELAAAGVADVLIGAVVKNAGAIRLYERRGFRPAWLYMLRLADRA